MEVVIGPEIVRSYKRLSYTPWHALAEFVDNSTQSFLDNRGDLESRGAWGGPPLKIDITYNRSGSGSIKISDNAMGMSEEELMSALHIGRIPLDPTGRSEFGMGLKTAACWFGDSWSVRTKKLDEKIGHVIEFNVNDVANDQRTLPHRTFEEPESEHYTIVQIDNLNRQMTDQEIAEVRRYLASLYRVDIRDNLLTLTINGRPLEWRSPTASGNVHIEYGIECSREFPTFKLNDKDVSGRIAVLERGGRQNAGFTIIRRGRVIVGYPNPWKPREIFGQYQGSNDLVNQRLVGEIHLDDFHVSHTKDGILWGTGEEEELGERLRLISQDYIEIALSFRKQGAPQAEPSRNVINSAKGLLREEMDSPLIRQVIAANGDVPHTRHEQLARSMMDLAEANDPSETYDLDGLIVVLYLADNLLETDPYLGIAIRQDGSLSLVINMSHPHVKSLRGSNGVFNHLKSCAYDGLAEWKAGHAWSSSSPLLIRAMKDAFLRVGPTV